MHEKKKIMIVFGTRPEAIKMAPVIKELEKHSDFFETIVVVTAQHREMLDQVLHVFDIHPNYDLNIMRKNQSLSSITEYILVGIEEIYTEEKPDLVLVHGDTTSSFTAALAAFYHKISVGHVEAGLRTYDKEFPFPEEANRQLIDVLTDLYFVPTETSKKNLLQEHKPNEKIIVTGNTSIDTIRYTRALKSEHPILNRLDEDKQWILLTMHRRENQGEPMKEVFQAVREIVEENEDVAVLMPVHLSPVVQQAVQEFLGNHSRIVLVEPLEVDVFHHVMAKSFLVLTDSGGLQEEAPALDKPVLVLRNKTERPEGEEAGTLKVIGTDKYNVKKEIETLLSDKEVYRRMASSINPYGDGYASNRIVKSILSYFEK